MMKNCLKKIKNLKLKIKNLLFIGLLVYAGFAEHARPLGRHWFTGLLSIPVYAAAPHLEFSPASGTISTSGTNVQVKIDTGGQAAKSAKAVVKFDTTKFEVSSVEKGTFFDDVSNNIYNSSGQVVINANLALGSSLESKTGTGTLATMNVKAKSSSGTGTLTFDCTAGSSTDSGINDSTPKDIIDCTANINGSYSLGSGSGSSASPSPSTAPIGKGGPTPSKLPTAGTTGPTSGLLILGIALILLAFPGLLILKK